MYYHFYSARQIINGNKFPFKAVIMAAMFIADLADLNILRTAYPDIHEEWQARVESKDGFITERERAIYGDSEKPE